MGVRVTGLEEVRARVEMLRDRARSVKTLLETEAVELARVIDRAWQERRSPAGRAWAPSTGSSGGSRLSRAHTVEASATKLRLAVHHPAAPFQFFGTEFLPARNPLPFERIPGGYIAVAEWYEPHAARVKAYLLGGGAGNER